MRHIGVPTYMHVAPTGIAVFGRRSTAPPIVRQPIPLPPLGVDPTIDRRVIIVLQKQLRRLGYHTAVTGRVGPDTREALTTFARSTHVSVDGPDSDRIVAVDRAYGDEFDPLSRI